MYESLSELFSVHIEDISPMNIYEVRFLYIILTLSFGQDVRLSCLFSLNYELKIVRVFQFE
jgi:hypothetical protein